MSLTLEDSTTYQWILKKGLTQGRAEGVVEGRAEGLTQGKIEEAQATILRLGAKRFGPPTGATEQAVRSVADHDRLTRMTDRLLDATTWDEVLATT